jgi:hypothetical protein
MLSKEVRDLILQIVKDGRTHNPLVLDSNPSGLTMTYGECEGALSLLARSGKENTSGSLTYQGSGSACLFGFHQSYETDNCGWKRKR